MTEMIELAEGCYNNYYKYTPYVQEGRQNITLGSKLEDTKMT